MRKSSATRGGAAVGLEAAERGEVQWATPDAARCAKKVCPPSDGQTLGSTEYAVAVFLLELLCAAPHRYLLVAWRCEIGIAFIFGGQDSYKYLVSLPGYIYIRSSQGALYGGYLP